jgi:hypothetical protein
MKFSAKDAYRSAIQFFTTTLDKATGKTSVQHTVRPLHDATIQPVSVTELEDMTRTLLAVAEASGMVVNIDQKGVPEFGMGGYANQVRIRPNYPTVRLVLDTLQAIKEGREAPPQKLKELAIPAPDLLRCRDLPWPDAPAWLVNAMLGDPACLPHHELVMLLKEYDRRLFQLWDKVGFERKHELVDYSGLGRLEDKSKGIDDVTVNQRGMFVSVFESRYGHGNIAMVSFNWEDLQKVEEYFQGDHDDDSYIRQLLGLKWYPIAAGKTAKEALTALDAKMKQVPLLSAGPDWSSYVRYVTMVNNRIRSGSELNVSDVLHFELRHRP